MHQFKKVLPAAVQVSGEPTYAWSPCVRYGHTNLIVSVESCWFRISREHYTQHVFAVGRTLKLHVSNKLISTNFTRHTYRHVRVKATPSRIASISPKCAYVALKNKQHLRNFTKIPFQRVHVWLRLFSPGKWLAQKLYSDFPAARRAAILVGLPKSPSNAKLLRPT